MSMLTVEEALDRILNRVRVLPAERAPLAETWGRALAEPIIADIPIPPFDNSAVDGYAVRAEATRNASLASPVALRTLGDVPAGEIAREWVEEGTAARIMTGAPIPPGADAVVMVEDTRQLADGTVAIQAPAHSGQHIRLAGQDMRLGETVLLSGTFVQAAEIGLLAATGHATVRVTRLPRVATLTTGDEVVGIADGAVPPPGKIRNSNAYVLAALVREAGAILHSSQHVPDNLAVTEQALQACAGADVIVTTGGVSVGDRDYIKPALERLGTLDLWRVAMKPGKPIAFGRIGETLFFGLPGNPASAMVTFEIFVRPALWKMAGRADGDLARREVSVRLLEAVPHAPGRREYVRAAVLSESGELVARTTGAQGGGALTSMRGANSLLIIPEASEGMSAGERCAALLLR